MARWFVMLALLGCPFVGGCTGSQELGPADPADTPQVSEEDVQRVIQQSQESMGEEARKIQQQRYGDSPGANQ